MLPNMPEVPKYQTELRVRRMAVDLLPFSAAAHRPCRRATYGWGQTFTGDRRPAVRLAEAFLTRRADTGAVMKAVLKEFIPRYGVPESSESEVLISE